MSFTKKAAAGLALSAVALASSSAWAAAFQLTEQSVVMLGRAYSGAGITGDDVSAPFYNPAAMTLLPGTQMQIGVIGVTMNQKVRIENPKYADYGKTNDGQNKTEWLPNFYITHQINPEWWVGLGVTTPFGLSTSYGQWTHGNWEHGDRGTLAELTDIDINPSFAWKPNDRISFGGGISIQYAKAKLGLDAFKSTTTLGMLAGKKMRLSDDALINALPDLISGVTQTAQALGAYRYGDASAYLGHAEETGDSWAMGWNLGFIVKPTDRTLFGISYRSAVKHKASGDFSFTPNALGTSICPEGKYSSKVTIKTPDTVYASGLWQATDKLNLMGTIRWAKWSNCYEWTLHQPSAGALSDVTIKHHYKDTWLFALGADYKCNEQWTVRGGIAYEKNAVDDQSYRVATIPDGDRLFLSLGCTYNFDQHWSIDTAALWVQGLGTSEFWNHDRSAAGAERIGKWTTQHSLIYGLQLRYKF